MVAFVSLIAVLGIVTLAVLWYQDHLEGGTRTWDSDSTGRKTRPSRGYAYRLDFFEASEGSRGYTVV